MARMSIDSGGSKSAQSSSTKGAKAPGKAKAGGGDKAALIKVVVSVVVILGAGVWLLYSQGYIGSPARGPVHAEAEPTPEQVQELQERKTREEQQQNDPNGAATIPRASS